MKPNADEVVRLLDNGWTVKLFRNSLGSYTAVARKRENGRRREEITDDFSPAKALHRLTERVLCGVIAEWSKP